VIEAAVESQSERFGRYTLLKPIASGGMAEIHLASFAGVAGVQKLVAIKRILPEYGRSAEFVSMFMNEARIAASLHHANVVQAYDFGCENGSYFLAMEYLRGQDIRRIVHHLWREGQSMPLEIAVAIGIGAAAGLHYLHDKRDADGRPLGLVHRDVSPPNIFLTSDGTVKLVDFGIAKAVHRAGETRTGTVKGKVTYLSPEQCRVERLDGRSDIFALAIVLWELTVGRRLYDQEGDLAIMNAITSRDAPPPSQMVPRYPRELERIVMKGLARDRNRRYQTAAELQDDLEAFARAERLPVGQGRVSSFVRSLPGASHLTVAALDSGTEIPPPPAQPAGQAKRGGALGRTRMLRPRALTPAPIPAVRASRSRRLTAFVGAFCLIWAIGGLGALWLFAKRNRPETAAPVGAVSSVARAPLSAQPVAAKPIGPPTAAAALTPTKKHDDVVPASRAKHDRPRRARAPSPSMEPNSRLTEKWSPDSALPPP
jgi:serine/threonine protein kinase